jgi:hypothetical protein
LPCFFLSFPLFFLFLFLFARLARVAPWLLAVVGPAGAISWLQLLIPVFPFCVFFFFFARYRAFLRCSSRDVHRRGVVPRALMWLCWPGMLGVTLLSVAFSPAVGILLCCTRPVRAFFFYWRRASELAAPVGCLLGAISCDGRTRV